MNKSYYEQLKSALLSRHSASEADETVSYTHLTLPTKLEV